MPIHIHKDADELSDALAHWMSNYISATLEKKEGLPLHYPEAVHHANCMAS